jgi:hypothetical protein
MPDVIPEPSLYSEALAHCATATRHDGWTRDAKVTFCEVLAITGRVVEALDAVNKSGNTAYAQRRRDPLFARAWALALAEARHRLADSLLARALDGTRVIELNPAGEVVRERHIDDNRLAFAVLRRLDRLAEGAHPSGRFHRPAADNDAQSLLATLDDALGQLLTSDEPAETHETHTPLADAWIGGDIRPPLRESAPLGIAGARRELLLSAMH